MIEEIAVLEPDRAQKISARQFEAALIAEHKITPGFVAQNEKVIAAGF